MQLQGEALAQLQEEALAKLQEEALAQQGGQALVLQGGRLILSGKCLFVSFQFLAYRSWFSKQDDYQRQAW